MVRYHFVVVDDKDREGIMKRILMQLHRFGNLEKIRSVEGKVVGTDYRYLFESYDCATAPRMIDWVKVGKPIRRDENLRERMRGSIEDYVAELYGN